MFAQVTRVAFNGFAFIVADALRVGLYKAAIKNTSGQTLIIVCLDGFEIVDGDSGLIADFAKANASLLSSESQLFAYTCCHRQSLVPGFARLDRR